MHNRRVDGSTCVAQFVLIMGERPATNTVDGVRIGGLTLNGGRVIMCLKRGHLWHVTVEYDIDDPDDIKKAVAGMNLSLQVH